MLPIQIKNTFLMNYEGMYFFSAILVGIIFLTYLAKKENIDVEKMYEALFISLITALITGRLFSFIFWAPKEFFSNPLIFFNFFSGGITVTGGVLGGLIAGSIYAIVKKLNFFYHIKIFVPSILIGQTIGRFGCFLNGDASGKATGLAHYGLLYHPNSVAYANQFTNNSYPLVGSLLHPTQLYEIFGNIILLVFILATRNNDWITKRRIVWYAMGYSAIRFIVEFFRTDSNRFKWFPVLTTGQIITIGGFLIGILILIYTLIFPNNLDQKPLVETK